MRRIIAGLVSVIAAACSESALPTETESRLRPRSEMVVLGGCPAPFTLYYILLREVDPKDPAIDPDADAKAADRNGDRSACYLTDQQDEKTIRIWIDNNVPLSQFGGCPNSFELAAVMVAGQDNGDDNGDGLVCTKSTGNGGTIIIDNNHLT